MNRKLNEKIRAFLVLVIVCLVVVTPGCSVLMSTTTSVTPEPGENQPATTATQTIPAAAADSISVHNLPPEGRTTLERIKSGGPFPFSQDGTVFNNFEGLLPRKATGYYQEYTVITPGSSDRGARRIVAGRGGEYYFTDDHYISFRLIVE